MAFDLNILRDQVEPLAGEHFGAENWTWISDSEDKTFEYIAKDWDDFHERTIRQLFPERAKTCIMAGGNCGMYPALLSSYFDVIYAFEPDYVNFHCLVNNCQFSHIVKIQAALGAGPGMVLVEPGPPDNRGMTSVTPCVSNSIPMMTVDQFCFKDVDLIFLDAEGAEFPILIGATKTLKGQSPKLIIELGYSTEERRYKEAVAFLASIGYDKVTHIGGADYLIQRND